LDRGIFVAIDGDIFHRDILRWRTVRIVVYPVLVLSLALEEAVYYFTLAYSNATSSFAQLGTYQILVVVPVVFTYSVAALLVGGRRTSDRTMKRHIRLLGFGLLCFIVSFPLYSTTEIGNLSANVLTLFANYFLYLAVMSLSSVGKVESPEVLGSPALVPSAPGTH
jgi:hypothetical protein